MRIIPFVIAILLAANIKAQDYQTPSPGKSMVYFVRTSGTGALINFKYFDGDKFLGKFNGMNCMTYECDPGEHTFWVAAENRRFVEADLQADKVYVVEVRPTMGAMKVAVKLFPVEKENEKTVGKVAKLMNKKEPKLMLSSESEYDEGKEFTFFIKNGLDKYSRDKQEGKQFPKLTSEMHHN